MKKQLCILLSILPNSPLYCGGNQEDKQPQKAKPKIIRITVDQLVDGKEQSYTPMFGTFKCDNGEFIHLSDDFTSKNALSKKESHDTGYEKGLFDGRVHGAIAVGLAGLIIGWFVGSRQSKNQNGNRNS